MNYFEKSLQGVADFDDAIKAAYEEYTSKRHKYLAELKEPTTKIAEEKEIYMNFKKEQRRIFEDIVNKEFSDAREAVKRVVMSPVPADVSTMVEAMKLNNYVVSEVEAKMLIEKYKDNYFAVKTIIEMLKKTETLTSIVFISADNIMQSIDEVEGFLLKWCREYPEDEYTTALLRHTVNPVISLNEEIQKFTNGGFVQ